MYLPRQRTRRGGDEQRSGQRERKVPVDPSEEEDEEGVKRPWKGSVGWR